MPLFDGTGPNGKGPMTGRGRGLRKSAKARKDSFIDLGDKPLEMASPTKKSEKYYPSLYIRKNGISKGVGKTGTATVKFKVTAVEMREGKPPEIRLDIMGIKENSSGDQE